MENIKNVIFVGENNSYIINNKNLNSIKGIEALNYEECEILLNSLMDSEKIIINDHEVFLIPLNGYFGYSALVFKNKKHLYYADDLQLHHKYYYPDNDYDNRVEHTYKTLKNYYMEVFPNKIFSDSQLLNADNYNEYQKKDYYIRNYWIQQFDYKSAFVIGGTDEEKQLKKDVKKYPIYNDISFCYMLEEDSEIPEKQLNFIKSLKESYKKILSDNEKFRKAIRYELDNHEACITMSYGEAVNALGLRVKDLTADQLQIVKQELNKCIESYC